MLDKLWELIASCVQFLQFACVVDVYERAVVLRLGKVHRLLEPGFHWFIPFGVERVMGHPIMLDTEVLREQSLTTKDNESITVTGIVSYEVDGAEGARKLLLEVQGTKQALEDSACGVIGECVLKSTWAEVTDPSFANTVTIAVRRTAKKYGIVVQQVTFLDLTKSRTLRLWNSSMSTQILQ
jgi:regulator of protease activity HflC (stomatin/prohibitin superfamily)